MAEKEQKDEEEEPAEEKAEAEPKPEGKEEGNAELRDKLLRMAAEFDNYRKRVAKDIDSSKEAGRADVIARLLPTVDEFELALGSFNKDDEHVKGIALIYSNLMSTLKGFGLSEIKVDGKFDPYRHETVMAAESDRPEGEIIEVVRKGYMLNDIMIRPASVIVAKSPKADQQDEDGKGK